MTDHLPGASPLTEANPFSIQDLFNKEPESLTDAEITAMVSELRKQRGTWLIAEDAKAAKAKKEKGIPLNKDEFNDLLKDL